MRATPAVELTRGTLVDVWCALTADWAHGFRVSNVEGTRVWVHRVSDGQLIPEPFEVLKVRPVR